VSAGTMKIPAAIPNIPPSIPAPRDIKPTSNENVGPSELMPDS